MMLVTIRFGWSRLVSCLVSGNSCCGSFCLNFSIFSSLPALSALHWLALYQCNSDTKVIDRKQKSYIKKHYDFLQFHRNVSD